MRALLLALVAGSFASPVVAADDTYDLRGPAPKKGAVLTTKSVLKITDADVVLKVNEQEIKLTQSMTITNEEEETILEVKDREVVKTKAKITKERIKTVTTLGGQDMSDEKTGDLEGQILSNERTKDGKWKASLVDGAPTDEQKKDLAKRNGPENDDELYPSDKVAPGHKWEVDAAKMKSLTGNAFTDVSGKMKQKFVKIEKIDGDECAVIETTGTIKGKIKGDDGETPDAELKLTATGWRSLKTGVEIKAKFEGTIKISGKTKVDGEEVNMSLTGPIKGDSTTMVK